MKRNAMLALLVAGCCSLTFVQGAEMSSYTASQAAARSLERITRWNDELNVVITLAPDVMQQAAVLDLERDAGNVRSPLHGVPVLVKDNIETRDMPTTAGSLALIENDTGRDAPLVARLREAGLLVTGKSNLSEWANFRSERSSSGWSGAGGQARNPHDPMRSPCGSSSGSGAAVAAGMVPLAVGTETNGSIICPASVNGIVGIKPTVGLISRRGIVPISHSQDTAGPMAASVSDAAHLLTIMAGADPEDPATLAAAQYFDRDYAEYLKIDGLEGKRIGVVRSLAGFHEGVDRALNQAVADLEKAGAEVVDELELPAYPEGFQQAAYDVLLYEFKHDLNQYLAGLPGAPGQLDLQKLIEFNRQNADREMQWFQQEIFLKSQEKGDLQSDEYLAALQTVQSFSRSGIDALLAEHDLDLLVSPSNTPAWMIDLVVGDRWLGSSSSFPARAGYPHITVPMGFVHGLPVGLSFYSTGWSEPVLIEAAYAYEQASRRARPPQGFGDWIPAVSENSGDQGLSLDGIISESLAVPTMVGKSARCEIADGEEGEGQTCG
jgi:amidase